MFKTSSIEFFTIFAEFLQFFYMILRSGTEVHPSDAKFGSILVHPSGPKMVEIRILNFLFFFFFFFLGKRFILIIS